MEGGLDVEAGVEKFTQAWHAQAFATTIALSRAGLFAWAKWVETFSAEIRDKPQLAGETADEAYYRQWLSALETIVLASGRVAHEEINDAMEHWRRSFAATPHGKPIVFRRDLPDLPDIDDDHDHHHEDDHAALARPVAVSPPLRR